MGCFCVTSLLHFLVLLGFCFAVAMFVALLTLLLFECRIFSLQFFLDGPVFNYCPPVYFSHLPSIDNPGVAGQISTYCQSCIVLLNCRINYPDV